MLKQNYKFSSAGIYNGTQIGACRSLAHQQPKQRRIIIQIFIREM